VLAGVSAGVDEGVGAGEDEGEDERVGEGGAEDIGDELSVGVTHPSLFETSGTLCRLLLTLIGGGLDEVEEVVDEVGREVRRGRIFGGGGNG